VQLKKKTGRKHTGGDLKGDEAFQTNGRCVKYQKSWICRVFRFKLLLKPKKKQKVHGLTEAQKESKNATNFLLDTLMMT
jgi:hypothetical protein